MQENIIKLSPRLFAIASLIKQDADIADIGSDHGHLPVYLAQIGLAKHIIASDISAGSLRAAFKTAKKYDVFDKIIFKVTSGLDGIINTSIDTVVISGLGGETIIEILSNAYRNIDENITFILQPQTKIEDLCAWLSEFGFVLSDARLVEDNERIYLIMVVVLSKQEQIPKMTYYNLLSELSQKNDPLFPKYIKNLIKKAKTSTDGLKISGSAGYFEAKNKLERLIEISQS